jgi:TRAP-type C4-dicarboxylate transport system permease small subunit
MPPADPDRAAGGWVAALGRGYRRAVAIFASAIMVVVVIVMGAQVFYRYVLNDSLIWAEEVSGYLLVVTTFLLIGAAFERGEMVSIRFFVDALPPRARLLLSIPSFVAMTGFLLVLAYYALRFASLGAAYNIPAAGFIGSALAGPDANVQVSMYWLYLTIPAGCLILSGHFLVALCRMGRAAAGRADPAEALPGQSVAPDASDV